MIRASRQKTAAAGGCNACAGRPDEVLVIEMDRGTGTTTTLRLCDGCRNEMRAVLGRGDGGGGFTLIGPGTPLK